MPPLGDVGADLWTGLEDEGFQTAVEQVSGGRQAHRAGPNHHDRQAGAGGGGSVGILNVEGLGAVTRHHAVLLKR